MNTTDILEAVKNETIYIFTTFGDIIGIALMVTAMFAAIIITREKLKDNICSATGWLLVSGLFLASALIMLLKWPLTHTFSYSFIPSAVLAIITLLPYFQDKGLFKSKKERLFLKKYQLLAKKIEELQKGRQWLFLIDPAKQRPVQDVYGAKAFTVLGVSVLGETITLLFVIPSVSWINARPKKLFQKVNHLNNTNQGYLQDFVYRKHTIWNQQKLLDDLLAYFDITPAPAIKKPEFDAFYLISARRRQGVTDSLLLDSDTVIISARIGGYEFLVRTQGYVTIVWEGETYTHRSDFPNELVEAIRDHSIDSKIDAQINENNWYEMTIWKESDANTPIYSDTIDLDDLSTLTVNEAKEIILDYLETAKECSNN